MTGPELFRYGGHPAQVCELHLPAAPDGPVGVAVLVHGGFWRARYDRSLEHPVAADLVEAGWAVWNVDYRGVDRSIPGPDGGGWPVTYQDAADAADLLVEVARSRALPLARVVAIGHSAGGALALWLAGRRPATPAGEPSPDPQPGVPARLRLHGVVAQAGVCDLATAYRDRVGAGAVADLFGGGPGDERTRDAYRDADPMRLLPLGIPTLLVTGDADDVVPAALSAGYAQAARDAGDPVQLWRDPSAGHRAHLDPRSPAWRAVRSWLDGPQ